MTWVSLTTVRPWVTSLDKYPRAGDLAVTHYSEALGNLSGP